MNPSIPGYIVGDELARTVRAVVYQGCAAGTGVPVVLKQVQNDSCARNEVAMLQRVAGACPDGPRHVVQLLGTHESRNDLWMALEPFDDVLDVIDPAKMTPMALMTIAAGSVKGLLEMHQAGVVDDDVKPGNIAFMAETGRVAHIDLDCCRLSGARPDGYTPEFVAPEIQAGIASDASPCYGWGRTMEMLVTGRVGLGPNYSLEQFVPWAGASFSWLVAQCCQPDPGRRPSVPELWNCVQKIVSARRRCSRDNTTMFPDGACRICGVKSVVRG